MGDKLTFLLNPGPALVEPSVTNPSDPNANKSFAFCEFTWNTSQFYGNISCACSSHDPQHPQRVVTGYVLTKAPETPADVDFVSIPISLTLEADNAATQHVSGMDQNGLAAVVAGIKQQDAADNAGWSQLVVNDAGSAPLRVLSPNNGRVANASLFSAYFDPYVQQVWDRYAGQAVTLDTQASFGTVSGQVSGGNLVFNPGDASFAAPSSSDIFGCSTGPFQTGASAEVNAIIPRLAAAFNRSTLLTSSSIPAAEGPGAYYNNAVTNHYSRIVHAANLDGRGYAFPYDDVAPTGGQDQSGSVHAGAPTLVTVAVGGNGAFVGDNEGTS